MKNVTDKNALDNPLKEKVTALYELMKSEKLEELEIRQDDFYLHMKRKGKAVPGAHMPPPAAAPQQAVVKGAAPQQAPAIPEGSGVTSPINGVFYRAPSPTAVPFVKEGDVAEAGKTLCIVEAMKVMNEIKADCRMKILKILVENGKPVNANQDLFLIEKM
jgi:acetyl-CoA carboxylase biotin carboxyl carrier protein